MMESIQLDHLKARSGDLFNNSLVVPVAAAILARGNPEDSFKIGDVRLELGGTAADNQIQQVLERLEKCGLLRQLPWPGRPQARMWHRLNDPFWAFIESWTEASAAKRG